MAFDIFFQGYVNGERRPGGGGRMAALVEPYVVHREPEFVEIAYGDGRADLYLDDDDMMASHVSGSDPWDLLVRGATAADWVIIPMGCAAALTGEHQRAHLPEDLAEDVDVVHSGAQLLALIER